MKTVLYARVSTAEQTIDHQKTQAEAAGFKIDEVLAENGISGVNVPLRDRPQGKRLFDMLRSGDTLVVRWIDRLGRNYEDVCDTLRELLRRGVLVRTVINDMRFDGAATNPMEQAVRDALIGFMAALGQAQAEATKEAQRAGIAHAKAKADTVVFRGRKPSYDRKTFGIVTSMLGQGAGASAIAKATGLTRQTVLRIRADPSAGETALSLWNM